MGMFDWVDYKCKCPKCGEEVTGFQTKNGDCTLEKISPHQAGSFYSTCKKCGVWIDCKVVVKEYQIVTTMRSVE